MTVTSVMTKTSMTKNNLSLVLTAAGSSTRMGGNIKKEYLKMESGTVLSTSLKKFLKAADFSFIVITTPRNGAKEAEEAVFCDSEITSLLNQKESVKILFTEGGSTRQESIFIALSKIDENLKDCSFVAIHDAARPFVSEKLIQETLKKAEEKGAACPGLEPKETQVQTDENGKIVSHLKRSSLKSVQTPQIFSFKEILEAHKKASNDGHLYTDDTEIWDCYAGQTFVIEGESSNIKITYPEDYQQKEKKMIHTGLGYDLHKLIPGRKLVLGGIEIPFEKGEDGHSDGDVLLHAITDALLGASGLGDIGSFFPPEDPEWKDADSKMLLKTVWDKIKSEGWKLENLDCVIKLEKPKFLPYRQQVIDSIAAVLKTESSSVFVKAKTYEKTGNWENQIEAFATCLLSK